MKSFWLLRAVASALLVFTVGAYAQTGWVWQNPHPQGNHLYGVKQIWDEYGGRGFAVGEHGTIFSGFGGSYYGFPGLGDRQLNAVTMSDKMHAWIAAGNPGAILFLRGYSTTWEVQYLDSSVDFRDIVFLDSLNGWAVGTKYNQWSSSQIIHTTNGGATWQIQYADSNSELSSLNFINHNLGWVTGTGKLMRTTDGGAHWTEFTPPTYNIYDLAFPDSLHGWIVGIIDVYATVDGGQSWTRQNTGTHSWLTTCKFVNASEGWVAGNAGLVLHTINGGNTWTAQNSGLTAQINAIDIFDYPYGNIMGNDGQMAWTNNAGSQWIIASSDNSEGTFFTKVEFGSLQSGWAIGAIPDDGFRVMHTSDGGTNWYPQTTNWIQPFRDLHAISADTAFMVGGGGGIFKTTNAGATWLPQYSGVNWTLVKCSFLNSQVGWVVSYSTEMLHTTDGGINWSSWTENAQGYVSDLKFTDEQNGWMVAVVDGGEEHCTSRLWHTTDGGHVWEATITVQDTGLLACEFMHDNSGWVVGDYGLADHTTDGGATWNRRDVGTTNSLMQVTFDGIFHGRILEWGCGILETTDGGATWTPQELPTGHAIRAIDLYDPFHCWAVGDGGMILAWTGPTDVSPKPGAVPEDFAFSAYPNPFNPTTTLAFDLPRAGNISLRLFDVRGRLVTTVCDQWYAVGKHELRFDGANLPSGIYFARLAANNTTKIQKLVMVK
jgi:photosystem II stability/assembly factor-like uncharacterized protein